MAVPPRPQRRWWWVAGAAGVATALALAVWKGNAPPMPSPSVGLRMHVVPLTTMKGYEGGPSFSPDDSAIVFNHSDDRGPNANWGSYVTDDWRRRATQAESRPSQRRSIRRTAELVSGRSSHRVSPSRTWRGAPGHLRHVPIRDGRNKSQRLPRSAAHVLVAGFPVDCGGSRTNASEGHRHRSLPDSHGRR